MSNPSRSFEDVYRIQTARIEQLERALTRAAAEVCELGCTCGDDQTKVLENGHEAGCMGVQYGKYYDDILGAKP
jgi:hypothetical protein